MSWDYRGKRCLVAAATIKLPQTLIKIPPETKRGRKTYLGFSPLVSSQCFPLVEPKKNPFGRELGNVVCRNYLSVVYDVEQSSGKWGRSCIQVKKKIIKPQT